MQCPYCGAEAHKVTGKEIYPHRKDLYSKKFYQCKPCDAYVGCHPNSDKPLGRLANADLRRAKMAAHAAFDPIWKSGNKSRSKAYSWLAEAMKLTPDKCHVGMFDVAQCEQVVALCKRSYHAS